MVNEIYPRQDFRFDDHRVKGKGHSGVLPLMLHNYIPHGASLQHLNFFNLKGSYQQVSDFLMLLVLICVLMCLSVYTKQIW